MEQALKSTARPDLTGKKKSYTADIPFLSTWAASISSMGTGIGRGTKKSVRKNGDQWAQGWMCWGTQIQERASYCRSLLPCGVPLSVPRPEEDFLGSADDT